MSWRLDSRDLLRQPIRMPRFALVFARVLARVLALNLILVLALAAGPSIPSCSALAAEKSVSQSSAVSLPKKWLKELQLGLFGWSYGPGLGAFGSGRTPTPSGGVGGPVTVVTQMNLSAPAFGQFRYTLIDLLTWSPFTPSAPNPLLAASNPALGVAGTHFDRNGFSWWARYELEPAVTSASRARREWGTARSVSVATYAFGAGRRWSVVGVAVPWWTILSSGTSNGLYLMPQVIRQVSDSVSLSVFLEAVYLRATGASFWDWTRGVEPNLAVSSQISFKNGYWVRPFLSVFPGGQISWKTAQLGAYFGGQLF